MRKEAITLLNERGEPYTHNIPYTSIYFMDKEYPSCIPCARRYLPELGCLWCDKITRKPKVSVYIPKEYKPKKPHIEWHTKQREIAPKKPPKQYYSWRQDRTLVDNPTIQNTAHV